MPGSTHASDICAEAITRRKQATPNAFCYYDDDENEHVEQGEEEE
jgi:hypothetical protein